MTTITQPEMAALVTEGKATRWTQPLGGVVPLAARVNGAWYVVLDTPTPDGTNPAADTSTDTSADAGQPYRPAPEQLAATLDRMATVLDLADAAVAAADRAAHDGRPGTDPGTDHGTDHGTDPGSGTAR